MAEFNLLWALIAAVAILLALAPLIVTKNRMPPPILALEAMRFGKLDVELNPENKATPIHRLSNERITLLYYQSDNEENISYVIHDAPNDYCLLYTNGTLVEYEITRGRRLPAESMEDGQREAADTILTVVRDELSHAE